MKKKTISEMGQMRGKIILFILYAVIGGIGGAIFYANNAAIIIGAAAGGAAACRKAKKGKDIRKLLRIQFRDFLTAFSSMLASGSEARRALRESVPYLDGMYDSRGCKDRPIVEELQRVNAFIETGGAPDKAFMKMSQRSGIQEITYFAYSFGIMYRKGGNIAALAEDGAMMISSRERVEDEIEVMTAEMVFNQRILLLIFPAAVAALRFSAPEYIAPLYSGVGRIVMTAALAAVILAWQISSAIVRVRY